MKSPSWCKETNLGQGFRTPGVAIIWLYEYLYFSGPPFPGEGGRWDNLCGYLGLLQLAFPVVVRNGIGLVREESRGKRTVKLISKIQSWLEATIGIWKGVFYRVILMGGCRVNGCLCTWLGGEEWDFRCMIDIWWRGKRNGISGAWLILGDMLPLLSSTASLWHVCA